MATEHWVMSGEAESRKALWTPHEHVAAEFEGLTRSEALRKKDLEDARVSKEKWVDKAPLLPPGAASSLRTEDQIESENNTAQMRAMGRQMLQSMRDEYDDKR